MKGLIMDIKDSKMTVMKDDGSFIDVGVIKGAKIGEEVDITERTSAWGGLYKYAGVAAAIMLFFTGGLQVYAYYTPYGYTSVDINPSVQIAFNKFDRVISAKGLNADGEKVVSEAGSIKNLKVGDGVAKIVQTADKDEYIKSDVENDIMVSTYSEDQEKAKSIDKKVNNSVTNYLNSSSKKAGVLREIVNKEDFDKASLEGVSVGKLILYRKALDANVDITLDTVKATPVRDIVKMINEKRKANEESVKQNKKTGLDKQEAVVPIPPREPKQDSIEDNQLNAKNRFDKNSQKSNQGNTISGTKNQNTIQTKGISSDSQTKANSRIEEIRKRIMTIIGHGETQKNN
ncbi:MAG: anti-sigma factor domain-containing protein [Bacteroidota bacterium]|nr:anti-sigma factor domain-containing protein [Bacteroidota bacterium]